MLMMQFNIQANITLFGVASQSSTNNGGVASHAIDDNVESITETSGNDVETWWKLDLRTVSSIAEVVIYNRGDCCSDRILGFHLLIWYEGEVVYSSENEDPDESSTIKDIYSFSLTGVKRADEVKILIPGANKVLSIAEVQVYGSENVRFHSLLNNLYYVFKSAQYLRINLLFISFLGEYDWN